MYLQVIGPDDPALEVLRDAIAAHPESSLRLETIPWAAYREKLMEALSAEHSSAQAVFVPGHIWLPELAEAGYLAPIGSLQEALSPEIRAAYDAEDIIPEVAQECRYAGEQYQLPFFTDGHLLFYRSDIVELEEKQGEVPVISMQMFQVLADKAHRPPDHYGLALKADVSEIFTDFLPYLWEEGGQILDEEGRPDFASDAAITALERYCRGVAWAPHHRIRLHMVTKRWPGFCVPGRQLCFSTGVVRRHRFYSIRKMPGGRFIG